MLNSNDLVISQNIKDIDELKSAVEKETINKIIRKLTVTDSYFYAEMVIMKHIDPTDPFSSDKIKVIIRMNLFNSKDFVKTNIINEKPKYIKAKEIKTEIILESEELIKSKEDIMMLVYEEVTKEIAKDLFQFNATNIQMTIKETQKKYI